MPAKNINKLSIQLIQVYMSIYINMKLERWNLIRNSRKK